MGPRVLVSHTREGGSEQAQRLVRDLRQRLEPEHVAGVQDRADSPNAINAEIAGCEVFIAVIGPGWLGRQDAFAGEVEQAIARRIPVIPVLTPGATLPSREALPDTIKALLNNHPRLTIEIASDFYWDVTLDHLARWLTWIATENERRQERRRQAAATRVKLERDIQRASEKLTAAEAAVASAETERARLDEALLAATELLAARQREAGPARTGAGIRVFISNRDETSADARKLESDLRTRLEDGRVFSSEPVPGGADPATVIGERIARCDVLLAMIGPNWLTAEGPHGTPAVEDSQDPVRLELLAALERGLPIIPMLTGRAAQPGPDALPEDLRVLADLPPVELLVPFWNEALADVVSRLKQVEAQIRTRQAAQDAAADAHRKLDREATRAAQLQVDTVAALAAAKNRLAELEQNLIAAREEEDQLAAEPDDANSAFREGPPRDIGTTSSRESARSERTLRRPPSRDRTVLLAAALVLVVILLIVII